MAVYTLTKATPNTENRFDKCHINPDHEAIMLNFNIEKLNTSQSVINEANL